MRGVFGLLIVVGCGGGSTPGVDAMPTDATTDAIQPGPDAAPFVLPEGLHSIFEMRVGSSGCGSATFTLTMRVTKNATGYEVVHDGSAQCSGMKLQCTSERLQLVIDATGLVTQTTPIDGTCVYSTDIADTPRAVTRRAYGFATGRLNEDIKLEGTNFPTSGTFVF